MVDGKKKEIMALKWKGKKRVWKRFFMKKKSTDGPRKKGRWSERIKVYKGW